MTGPRGAQFDLHVRETPVGGRVTSDYWSRAFRAADERAGATQRPDVPGRGGEEFVATPREDGGAAGPPSTLGRGRGVGGEVA